MNCWEILGIDPTRDRAAIDRAYEQLKEFATDEELERLQRAYQEASGELTEDACFEPQPEPRKGSDADLTAEEKQVVREVVIQIKALLNDSRRSADEGIWKAILKEPPADQPHLRSAVAEALEPRIRPMADNGSFPPPIVAFLGDWFGWQGLQKAAHHSPAIQSQDQLPEHGGADGNSGDNLRQTNESPEEDNSQQPTTSFWPAVVGWIVTLAVLAAFFDSIFGG